MTVTVDLVTEFRSLLPAAVGRQLHDTQRLVALLAHATRDQRWPLRQLAQECARDLGDVVNPGAVVMHRLEKAAEHPAPHQTAKRAQRHAAGCDGWIYNPDTATPTSKCAGCAPNPGRTPA